MRYPKQRRWFAGLLAVIAAMTLVARAQQNARELFERARLLEENSKTADRAVEMYQHVIALSKNDRALTAEAELHIGLIRERQGKREARETFANIVRDFGDQPAAAIAKTKLDTASPNDTQSVVVRQAWSDSHVDLEGQVSDDGRYLTFVDWSTFPKAGNVAIRDLVRGENRLLTAAVNYADGHADTPVLSPDGKTIVYAWGDADVRLIDADGSHERILVPASGSLMTNFQWSPDGKQIAAVAENLVDKSTRLALITVWNGQVTTLKSTGWQYPRLGGYSPDGALLVYSLPNSPSKTDGGVFAVAVNGSREVTLTQGPSNDTSPVWTPDGRAVVFLSDRSGTRSLWMVAFKDGKAAGPATLLRSEAGEFLMGFSHDGSLYYGTNNSQQDVYVAGIDPERLKVTSAAAPLSDRFVGSNKRAAWSPDGRWIAFLRGEGPRTTLVVRSTLDGTERTMPTKLLLGGPRFGPEWFPDSRSLLISEVDYVNRRTPFRQVDLETGRETPLFELPLPGGAYPLARFSPDGRWLYYAVREGGSSSGHVHLVRRDIKTGQQTEVYAAMSEGIGYFGLSVSPDGTTLAFMRNLRNDETRDGATRALFKMPADGGAPVELYRGDYEHPLPQAGIWTRDGRFVLVAAAEGPRNPTEQRQRVWAFPVGGGDPLKLDIVVQQIANLDVSPDGRHVIFTGTKRQPELWTIRNLLRSAALSR